jgi:hypothetical protein
MLSGYRGITPNDFATPSSNTEPQIVGPFLIDIPPQPQGARKPIPQRGMDF